MSRVTVLFMSVNFGISNLGNEFGSFFVSKIVLRVWD